MSRRDAHDIALAERVLKKLPHLKADLESRHIGAVRVALNEATRLLEEAAGRLALKTQEDPQQWP